MASASSEMLSFSSGAAAHHQHHHHHHLHHHQPHTHHDHSIPSSSLSGRAVTASTKYHRPSLALAAVSSLTAQDGGSPLIISTSHRLHHSQQEQDHAFAKAENQLSAPMVGHRNAATTLARRASQVRGLSLDASKSDSFKPTFIAPLVLQPSEMGQPQAHNRSALHRRHRHAIDQQRFPTFPTYPSTGPYSHAHYKTPNGEADNGPHENFDILCMSVSQLAKLASVDVEKIANFWHVFTKKKSQIRNGERLEYFSWRLWFKQRAKATPAKNAPHHGRVEGETPMGREEDVPRGTSIARRCEMAFLRGRRKLRKSPSPTHGPTKTNTDMQCMTPITSSSADSSGWMKRSSRVYDLKSMNAAVPLTVSAILSGGPGKPCLTPSIRKRGGTGAKISPSGAAVKPYERGAGQVFTRTMTSPIDITRGSARKGKEETAVSFFVSSLRNE